MGQSRGVNDQDQNFSRNLNVIKQTKKFDYYYLLKCREYWSYVRAMWYPLAKTTDL